MPSDSGLTARRRDLLLAVVALALLAAPVWVPAVNVGEPTYAYERVQIVADDEDGIAYVDETDVPPRIAISDDVACSNAWEVRPCAFERYLASNETIPTEVYTNNPDAPQTIPVERYRYALIDGDVYETAYVANRSVQNDDGLYRIDLALEPASAEDVLRTVSLDASAEYVDAPSVVVEAATEGRATAHHEAEVPRTPLRLDDGRYYRVYEAGSSEPSPFGRLLRTGFPTVGPLVGLGLAVHLSRRVEVTHVGDDGDRR